MISIRSIFILAICLSALTLTRATDVGKEASGGLRRNLETKSYKSSKAKEPKSSKYPKLRNLETKSYKSSKAKEPKSSKSPKLRNLETKSSKSPKVPKAKVPKSSKA